MVWLKEFLTNPTSVESTLLILALVIAAGMALGRISFRGIRLGVAGILFVGLTFGHFGFTPDPIVLTFAREFGLVIFVFAIGLSIGPGFFNALRSHGLTLNLLGASVVLLGVLITAFWMIVGGIAGPIAVGLYCGATTNTPSLAAAGQALRDYPPDVSVAREALRQVAPNHELILTDRPLSETERTELLNELTKLPAMAYAVSYPGGVFGIIAAILVLSRIFRVDPVRESQILEAEGLIAAPPLTNMHVRVTNPNLVGMLMSEIPALDSLGVVVSRLIRGAEESVAVPSARLQADDVLLAVGESIKLQQFVRIVGEPASLDSSAAPSQIVVQWVTVSRKKIAEHTVAELALIDRFGVQLTRIRRAGVELPPLRSVRLHLGDEIHVVGLPEGVAKVAEVLGDSPRQLNEPDLLPIFLGITLGVLVGSIPFRLPGVPGAVKLGLAGGPLLVAIVLSRVRRIGPFVWYMPRSANLLLRDVGIAIFLASVGIKSGDLFVSAFVNSDGLWWLAMAAVITFLPLMFIGVVAHLLVKESFLSIIGMLAGSMTDPPALAFANSLCQSEFPSVSYATVYPLAMMLRIMTAQLLMLYWSG
jgi:putative transport protein